MCFTCIFLYHNSSLTASNYGSFRLFSKYSPTVIVVWSKGRTAKSAVKVAWSSLITVAIVPQLCEVSFLKFHTFHLHYNCLEILHIIITGKNV